MIHYNTNTPVKHHVCLDTIKKEDLQKLNVDRNRQSTFKWCRQTSLISEMDQEQWYKKINTDPTIKMFSIFPLEETSKVYDVIGVCGLTSINTTHGTAEFSILIHNKHRGKRYGVHALRTLLRHGFEDLRLNCIWGETFKGNPGMGMYKRLGFTKEGTLRQRYFKGGAFIDTEVYSITADEFKR